MDNRARARDRKHRRQMSLEFNSGGERMRMLAASEVKMSGST